MQNAIQNKQTLINAAITANGAYNARKNASGMQSDIARGIKVLEGFSEAQMDIAVKALNIDIDALAKDIATSTNVKKVLRVSQFLGFLTSSDANYLKGSAKCALLAFAVTLCHAKNRAGIYQGLTRKAHSNAVGNGYDLPAYERATKLVKVLNDGQHMHPTTAPTQISVCYSNGGILPALGITGTMARKGDVPDINDTPATRALIAMIESASDSTFDIWAGK